MLQIKMLGGFEVRVDGQLVTNFQAIKAEALLAYLAYKSPQPLRRDGLAGLLWPDHDQEKAQTNLRKSLSRLKQATESYEPRIEYVQADRIFLQFNEGAAYEIDTGDFERLLEACPDHRALHNIACEICVRHIEDALKLYRGEFLQNFFVEEAELFDEWMVATREHLHHRALSALQYLAQYYEYQGDYAKTLFYARHQLNLEPWMEEAHRQIMRVLVYQGEYNAALAHYRMCSDSLQKNLGVEPSLETRQLAKHIQSLPAHRLHNLPTFQDKMLVKRDQQYNYIRQNLVKQGRHVLTLAGLGGIGKTTLALEVAWSVIDEHFGPFVDGVCYITLLEEDLRFSRLLTEIADFFSISLAQTSHPERIVFQHLKQKECLLILDNGEYLGDEGKRFIQELLTVATSVKILVVSRESLKLSLEWLLTLDGLSLPEMVISAQDSAPQTSGALRLFEQRSQKIVPGFQWKLLDDANQNALLRICHLTQGLPLALELAASWISKLSCQQIAIEIQNSLDILVSQYRDVSDRHQSIRAVFSYSWRMLSEQEQQHLMALVVFPGDFDLEPSLQITGVNLFALSALIDRSLLKSIMKSGRVYYQMHNLLRQFVQEQCSPQRLRDLRLQHAAYYSRFLDTQRRQLRSAETSNVSHDVFLELDNLRAGWRLAVDTQQVGLLDSFIDGFYEYYALKGWWQEGLGLFSTALDLFQAIDFESQPQAALVYTRLLTRIAEFHYSLGQLKEAEMSIQQAQKTIQLIEEPGEMALIYEKLGRIAHQYGNFAWAEQNIRFSLQIIESHNPNGPHKAHILMSLGAIARDQEHWEQAEVYFQQSLEVYQGLSSDWGIGHTRRLLAGVAVDRQQFARALLYAQQSLVLFQKMEDLIGEALALREMGRLALAQRQYDLAETHFQKALENLKQKHNVKSQALLSKDLGSLMLQCARYREAQQYFLQAFQDAYQTRDTLILMESLALLVEATLLEGRIDAHSPQFIALINFLFYNVNVYRSKVGPILDRIGNCLPFVLETILTEDYPNSIEDIFAMVGEYFSH